MRARVLSCPRAVAPAWHDGAGGVVGAAVAIAIAFVAAGCGGGRGGAGHESPSGQGEERGPAIPSGAPAPFAQAARSAEVARQAEARAATGATGGTGGAQASPRRYASALGAQVSVAAADRGATRERVRAEDVVTLKLAVDPPKLAHVFWGVKDLGLAPLELQRPRGSGPLDLVVRAPGYLAHHTRVFTDRNDRLAIHLAPESDGARYFGYRAPEHTGKGLSPSTKGLAKRAAPVAAATRAAVAQGARPLFRTLPSRKTAGVSTEPVERAEPAAPAAPADTPAAAAPPDTAASDEEKRDDPAPEP